MLVQLGAILATTLAVLYAIAFQPRPVAIGALAVGVSALLVAALPPRIRGGGWPRRTMLSVLPALGASAAAQPASPRPSWADPQVRTREGCECKAVTTDYTAPPGAPFQWAEGRTLEGGPAWCDVEAGCPNAIDKTGDGPGDYHGWDRVDVTGPENLPPIPWGKTLVNEPPPEDVRQLFVDQSLAPPYSREVAEAVRRGATVPWMPPSNPVAIPRQIGVEILGTTRPGPGPDNVQPRPSETVVPETTPQDEGYDIVNAAAEVAVPALGATGIIRMIDRLRGQNRGEADPRHPLLDKLEFTHPGGIVHSGLATVTTASREPIILVSLVGGTGRVQVHVTDSTEPSNPPWADDAPIWKATKDDQTSYGYTERDARGGIGSTGVTAQEAESLSDCCATLLKFYAPPPPDGNLPSIASSNVDLQVETELSPDDIAVARLPSVAHWTDRDRGCMVAIRPSPSQSQHGDEGFRFSIHCATEQRELQRFKLWVHHTGAEDAETAAEHREKIATSTRSLMNKAKSSLHWDDVECRRALNDFPSCSLAQIQRIVYPGHAQLSPPGVATRTDVEFILEPDEDIVMDLIHKLRNLQEGETPFTSEKVGDLSKHIAGYRQSSEHRPVKGYDDKDSEGILWVFKLLHTIYEVRLRVQFIEAVITRGLSTRPCTYSGDNDCTAHPLRAAMRATAQNIETEQGEIEKLKRGTDDRALVDYLARRVDDFNTFYGQVHTSSADTDSNSLVYPVISLPFPVWHVDHDEVVYDPTMVAKNILYHMTHEIIVPYLIPFLESSGTSDLVKKLSLPKDKSQRETQDFILEQVYGTELEERVGELQKLIATLRAQPQ